jgi:hypothetical protein
MRPVLTEEGQAVHVLSRNVIGKRSCVRGSRAVRTLNDL